MAVTTWDGRLVGLIVGGAAHRVFVCPVTDFLQAEQLTLCLSPAQDRDFGKGAAGFEAAYAAHLGDLTREDQLEDVDWDLEAA